jgi:hypothetical protein
MNTDPIFAGALPQEGARLANQMHLVAALAQSL